jgi:magnesium-transporting ATPase (P-type)
MKIKIILPLVFLFLISGLSPLNGQGLILQKNITVEEHDVQDNVVSFGGTILVKGKVNENVIAFGGNIIIEGEVGVAVVGFGTKITLESSAVINGDVVSIAGELEKHPGAFVKGDTMTFFFETPEALKGIFKNGLSGLIPIILFFKLISLFFWFILAILLSAIFPRQTMLASNQLRASFWPTFGVGFLSIVVYTGLILFSAVLTLVLIGIPVLITLIALGIAVKIFGRIVIFYFFGESLTRAFNKKNPATIAIVLFGFLLVSFITLIPILGSLFSFVISILGWGAVIRTKFGTTEKWSKKKQPVPPLAE